MYTTRVIVESREGHLVYITGRIKGAGSCDGVSTGTT